MAKKKPPFSDPRQAGKGDILYNPAYKTLYVVVACNNTEVHLRFKKHDSIEADPKSYLITYQRYTLKAFGFRRVLWTVKGIVTPTESKPVKEKKKMSPPKLQNSDPRKSEPGDVLTLKGRRYVVTSITPNVVRMKIEQPTQPGTPQQVATLIRKKKEILHSEGFTRIPKKELPRPEIKDTTQKTTPRAGRRKKT